MGDEERGYGQQGDRRDEEIGYGQQGNRRESWQQGDRRDDWEYEDEKDDWQYEDERDVWQQEEKRDYWPEQTTARSQGLLTLQRPSSEMKERLPSQTFDQESTSGRSSSNKGRKTVALLSSSKRNQ